MAEEPEINHGASREVLCAFSGFKVRVITGEENAARIMQIEAWQ